VINALVTFGEDDDAELYAANLQGVVYRVGTKGSAPVNWRSITLETLAGGYKVSWSIDANPDIELFELQRSADPDFNALDIAAGYSPGDQETEFSIGNLDLQTRRMYYRVAARMEDGTVRFSPTVISMPDPRTPIPGVVIDQVSGALLWELPPGHASGMLVMYDILGREIVRRPWEAGPLMEIPRPAIPGSYVIRITAGNQVYAGTVTW
jgi:hypothetical protein